MKKNNPFEPVPTLQIKSMGSKDNINNSRNVRASPRTNTQKKITNTNSLITQVSSEFNIQKKLTAQVNFKQNQPIETMKRYDSSKVSLNVKRPEKLSLSRENTNRTIKNKNSKFIESKFSLRKTEPNENSQNNQSSISSKKVESIGGRPRLNSVEYMVKTKNVEAKNKKGITPFNPNDTPIQNQNCIIENRSNQNNTGIKESFNITTNNNTINTNNNIKNTNNIIKNINNTNNNSRNIIAFQL